MTTRSNRIPVLVGLAFAILLAFRIPSIVQPAGADQGLYAYVGQRILAGDLPYRDAWDQKPPAVHYTYALMLAVWPHESVVAATDALVAAAIAVILLLLGRPLGGSRAAGVVASLLYLLLANPALTRLGGVRIRAQCETFIGLAVAVALLIVVYRRSDGEAPRPGRWFAGGVAVGIAGLYKYPALAYALPLLVFAASARYRPGNGVQWRPLLRDVAVLGLGLLTPVVLALGYFLWHGALLDLYHATITYNLRYSGETYEGPWHLLTYLLTFPVGYARLDSLYLLGGAGSALLLIAGLRQPRLWTAPAWVAAACLAIAVNGSRGLPQYFVQAWPALALTAGLAAVWLWSRTGRFARATMIVLVVLAVPRVTTFPKLLATTITDWQRLTGQIARETYLARFGDPDSGAKYSALAVHRLARLLRSQTGASDRVFVFGFSPWAYVGSDRPSASRFFWSRPVIIGFEPEPEGYGIAGLLGELRRHQPAMVVLQERDWDPDGPNSADFFLSEPALAGWLHARYQPGGRLHNFQLWTMRDPAP